MFTGLIAVVSGSGLSQLFRIITEKFSNSALLTGIPLPLFIDSPVPVYSNLVYIAYFSLFLTLIAGVIIFILRDMLKKPGWMILFALIAIAALVPLSVRSFNEAGFSAVKLLISLLWILIIIKYIARNNYMAYIFTFILITCFNTAYQLIKQGNGQLLIQGAVLLFLLLLFTVWLLLPAKQRT